MTRVAGGCLALGGETLYLWSTGWWDEVGSWRPLSAVDRVWQEGTGGDGAHHLQLRPFFRSRFSHASEPAECLVEQRRCTVRLPTKGENPATLGHGRAPGKSGASSAQCKKSRPSSKVRHSSASRSAPHLRRGTTRW